MTQSALVLSIALAASLTAPAPLSAPKRAPSTPSAERAWELRIGNPAPAERFVIDGRVLDFRGNPLRDLRMQVHHANAKGNYDAYRGGSHRCAGMLRTNVLGEFHVETELPGVAEEVPHIDFTVEDPTGFHSAAVNLARASGPGSDEVYGRLPWMLELPSAITWTYVAREADGALHAHYDFHVESRGTPNRPQGWMER